MILSIPIDQLAVFITIAGGLTPTVAWYWERRTRRRLESERQRRIWSDISKIRGLMVDLEKDELPDAHGEGRLQAVGKLTMILRDLIREASLAEKNYTPETIARWRAVGKLGSDWQEHLALMLLSTQEIGDTQKCFEELRDKYGSTEELPDNHPMQAPPGGRRLSPLKLKRSP